MPYVVAVVAAIVAETAITATMVIGAIAELVMVASIAYSAYSMATMKNPDSFASEVAGRTQVIRSSASPHRVIYGKCIISGPLVAAFSCGTNNQYVYLVIVLASHEVESIDDVYVDDVLSTDLTYQSREGTYETVVTETFTIPANKTVRANYGIVRISSVFDGGTAVTDYENYGRTFIFGSAVSVGASVSISYVKSFISVAKYLGTATQAADPDMVADAVDRSGNHVWTANHKLTGRAYIVVRLEYDPVIFTKLPNIKAVVKGVNDIYDPRTATTGWTDNAALCVRDFLVKAHGIAAASADIDDTNFIASANICDETVQIRVGTGTGYTTDDSGYEVGRTGLYLISGTGTILAGDTITITVTAGYYTVGGVSTYYPASANSYVVKEALISTGYIVLTGDGLTAALPPDECAVSVAATNTEKRYTCNGTFTLDQKPIDIMKKMLTSCAGRLIWSQGQYKIYPAAYTSPVATGISESDLRDDIQITPAPSRAQRFNTVRGTFVSPAQYWQLVDFPLQQDATQYAADGSEICQNLELPYTNSSPMAQRLARIYLNQNIKGITMNFPGKLTCFSLQPGDNIPVTIDELSWSDKEFRCNGWKLSETGGIDLVLREEDSSVYTWTLSDEVEYIPPNKSPISHYSPAVPDAENFTATQNGSFVIFSWDEVLDPNGIVGGYEIRYTPQGTYTWDDGTPISQTEKGTHLVSLKVAPGAWKFWIMVTDKFGNYSVNADTYDLEVINSNTIVYGDSSEAESGWPGTAVNFVKHWTGVLVPQSQGVASDDGWDTFNIFVPNPYAECSYEAEEITIDHDYTLRAHGEVLSISSPIPVGMASPKLYIKWHKDGEAYGDYVPWSIGDITAIAAQMKFFVDTSIGVPIIEEFTPTLDAVPRTEQATDVPVLVGGTNILYASEFINKPVLTAQATGTSSLNAVPYNQTTSGFSVKVYDSTGAATAGTINWNATGV